MKLPKIIWRGSPNADNNRLVIDRIVIHWFGTGDLSSADARFRNDASNVSAHYGISDNKIYQWVEESRVAYHAGDYEMNRRSVGIEHNATTDHPASDTTYANSALLVASLCLRYGIPLDRQHIIGHREVKATRCPGSVDIDRIIRDAEAFLFLLGDDEKRALGVLEITRQENGFGNLEATARASQDCLRASKKTVKPESETSPKAPREAISQKMTSITNPFAYFLVKLALLLQKRRAGNDK